MQLKPAYALLACFGLVLGGCSSDEKALATQAVPAPSMAAVGGMASPHRVARIANQGSLASVDPTRKAYRSGTHVWLPVAISEDHALAAVQSGRLILPIPGGLPVPVIYSRHVDHDDGNWTFVGSGPDGADAVITFGPDAVFGSMHTATATLRITSDTRGAWLVSSPRGSDNTPPIRPGGDMLLPPDHQRMTIRSPKLASSGRWMASAESVAAQADPVVVDVIVGFTEGFAAARGGESAARTRVVNLLEITNQAYANSALAARVRLAHAMPVTFPDATDNGNALEKLTGYKSGVGSVATDPAFQGLLSARDQYGADVVVLLRNFQTPENAGCGIAWLLGSGLAGIDQGDAAFAYSVVSDGSDIDAADGKTYFCREETFAHEIGHLMGQTHNSEDSSSQGAHAYSYGYRQSTQDGFYTVMAYRKPDSQQMPIRYFANPAVAYLGAPTGIENTADNVRSLRQTIPAVAAFRLSLVTPPSKPPAINDLDGDGKSDMVWRGPDSGYLETWRMDGGRLARALGFSLPAGQRVIASGDFNGDRLLDLLVQSDSGQLIVWQGNGVTFGSLPLTRSIGAGWKAVGNSDVDGDGRSDLVWSNPNTNYFETWLMDGAIIKGSSGFSVPSDARVMTVGDFNGDGKADVLIASSANTLSLWTGDGVRFASAPLSITTPFAPGWGAWGGIDMNADGRSDLLWSTSATAYFEWWNMSGALVQRASGATPPADQRVAGAGDFNGDGMADVLLKGLGNDLHIGISDGILFNRTSLGIVAGPGWLPLVPGKP